MDDHYLYLKVENNTLLTYPFEHELKEGYSFVAFPSEHINSFLEAHGIVPTYIDSNYDYGYYDEVNGKWTGMIGHVSRWILDWFLEMHHMLQIDTDRAGLAVGLFQFTEQVCAVTLCIEMDYGPLYLFSKYPERVAPFWNLIQLLPPLIWGLILISIILVIFIFQLSSLIYSKLGLKKNIIFKDLVLIPVRYI